MHAKKAFIDADMAQLQSFLTPVLDGYELSASCPGHFPRERVLHFQWKRDWIGPTDVEPVWTSRSMEKSHVLAGFWNPHRPVLTLVTTAE